LHLVGSLYNTSYRIFIDTKGTAFIVSPYYGGKYVKQSIVNATKFHAIASFPNHIAQTYYVILD